MKISTKTRYGVRLLLSLAIEAGEGCASISKISREQDISFRYAEHILLTLKNAGILKSRRGIGGGFYFARATNGITIYDIYRILDGKPELADCLSDDKGCEKEDFCASKEVWANVQKVIIDEMKKYTLSDIIEKQRAVQKKGDVDRWKGSYI